MVAYEVTFAGKIVILLKTKLTIQNLRKNNKLSFTKVFIRICYLWLLFAKKYFPLQHIIIICRQVIYHYHLWLSLLSFIISFSFWASMASLINFHFYLEHPHGNQPGFHVPQMSYLLLSVRCLHEPLLWRLLNRYIFEQTHTFLKMIKKSS